MPIFLQSPTPVHPVPTPPPRRPRPIPCIPQGGTRLPSHKPSQSGYIPNDSVRKPSINRLQVAVASVSIPFPISFGRTMYLAMASAHESAPGRGRRLHRESTVLHYSHHGQNYEKRALMHHSSCLCSFSRPRPNSAHESAPSPCFKGRCAVNPPMPCLAPCLPDFLKLRRSHACVSLPRKCRFPKCVLPVVVRGG